MARFLRLFPHVTPAGAPRTRQQHRKAQMKPSLSLCRLAAPGLFSCLVALGHAGTLAQEKITEQGPYVGKLAGREVVARFSSDAQGMPMPGSYFYRDTGREVVLFYDAAQRRFIECMPTWQEEETVSGCGEPGGYWDVHVMRNAVLVDWRARGDDRPLRAVLTKADPPWQRRPGCAGRCAATGGATAGGTGAGTGRGALAHDDRAKVEGKHAFSDQGAGRSGDAQD